MTDQFRHLDAENLAASAGGDPWQLNRTVQSGSPGEISELATAFRSAGVCTSETTEEFLAAKQRFEAAWDRQDGGGHPINDSAEVRHATESLHLKREQLDRVAVDLQNISATLAEAQRSGDISLANLNAALRMIDDQIDREIAAANANGQTVDVSELEQAAVDRTRQSLDEMNAIRDAYASELDKSRLAMAADGYEPTPLAGTEGSREAASTTEANTDAQQYGSGQRATDEAIVGTPGPLTPEKQAAAGRLRDYATVNNPTASLDEIRYAGQRLDDYQTATALGPQPTDPVLGGDARSQARTRLELQQKLEQGLLNTPPIPPDQATAIINQSQSEARALVISRVEEQLVQAGMSPDGAAQAASSMSQGVIPKELVDGASAAGKPVAGIKEAFDRTADSLPTGGHWEESVKTYSPSDVEALKSVGSRLGVAGNLVSLGTGLYEIQNGVPAGQVIAKAGGGMAGAWALGAVGAEIGAFGGPPGVFIGAATLGTVGAIYGEDAGKFIYDWLTNQ